MRDIQFVSYDGAYPNLCSGTLVLSVDGENISADFCLMSEGEAGVILGGEERIIKGPWRVKFWRFEKVLTFPEMARITELVNQNVEWGCCGGCI